MTNQDVKIDKEFEELIPPMSAEEFKQLRDNVVRDGCRDPISIWDDYIIDGFNRYKICQDEEIPYETIQIRLKDRDDAKNWIILNQLGKRNLRPQQISMLRGMLYNASKEHGGDRKSKDKNCKNNASDIADKTGVSESTVKGDGKFADAVNKVEEIEPGMVNKVMSGDAPSKAKLLKAAKIMAEDPDKAKKILSGEDDSYNLTLEERSKVALEAVKKAIEGSVTTFKKVFCNEVVDMMERDDRQKAEMLVDAYIMKVEQFKDWLQKE